MNIGIFSGSFNPIHIGHLILGNYVTEFTHIDEVWFLVSPHNPLKKKDELVDENIRMEMVDLALKPYPKMKASDFEFSLPKPSYTINTLESLKVAYPFHDFSLIIGSDNWHHFEEWKDYEKIIDKCSIMIYPRLGSRISISSKLKNKVSALDSPIIDISSTFVRDNISEGKNVRPFLPELIFDYILKNKLYQNKF